MHEFGGCDPETRNFQEGACVCDAIFKALSRYERYGIIAWRGLDFLLVCVWDKINKGGRRGVKLFECQRLGSEIYCGQRDKINFRIGWAIFLFSK